MLNDNIVYVIIGAVPLILYILFLVIDMIYQVRKELRSAEKNQVKASTEAISKQINQTTTKPEGTIPLPLVGT